MFTKHVSIVIALIATAAVSPCAATEVFAQTASSAEASVPYTSSGEVRGFVESPQMPSPPPGSNDFRPPEMTGRPIEGDMNRPPDDYYRNYQSTEGGVEPPRGQTMPPGYAPQNGFGNEKGNSEEMERKMEEREKMMRQEQLKQMKRGFVSGLEQSLKQIKRTIDKLSKKGVAVPMDASTAVTELSAALEKIKDATELTPDVEAAIEVIQDRGMDLRDIMQTLGTLEHLSEATTRITKEFARIDKEIAKAKKSKMASQYPDVIAKLEGEVGALKGSWEGTKSEILSSGSDAEDVRGAMEEIFEEIGDIRHGIRVLQQLGSISKMIKSAEKEIARFDKEVARQKKAGKGTTTLSALLKEGMEKLEEIKTLIKQGNADPEDLFDRMQELETVRRDAIEELQKITGKAETNALGASVIQTLMLRRLGF